MDIRPFRPVLVGLRDRNRLDVRADSQTDNGPVTDKPEDQAGAPPPCVPDYRGGPPVFWELRDGLDEARRLHDRLAALPERPALLDALLPALRP